MKLTFLSEKTVIGDVKTFIFSASQPTSWVAGQYMHYMLPHNQADDRGEERWFTISSPPYDGKLELTTRILKNKGSSFKNCLASLKIGDQIEVDLPEGDFVVTDTNANYVFIAGGIGITPFHSILLQLNHESVNLNSHLLYGNRDENYLFKSELDKISSRMSNFKIDYITEPTRISETEINSAAKKYENPYYYISGPEPMVEYYKAQLVEMGIPENRIRADYFPGYVWSPEDK